MFLSLKKLRPLICAEHDLIGKPVPTFPDHAQANNGRANLFHFQKRDCVG
jgi:hypothetical protein